MYDNIFNAPRWTIRPVRHPGSTVLSEAVATAICRDTGDALMRIRSAAAIGRLSPARRDQLRQLIGELFHPSMLNASDLTLRARLGEELVWALLGMREEHPERLFMAIELDRGPAIDPLAPVVNLRLLTSSAQGLMKHALMTGWIGLLRLEPDVAASPISLRPVVSTIAWMDEDRYPEDVASKIAGHRSDTGKGEPSGIQVGRPMGLNVAGLVRDLVAPPTVARGKRLQIAQGLAGSFRSYPIDDDLVFRQIELHSMIPTPSLLVAGGAEGIELSQALRLGLLDCCADEETDRRAVARAAAFWQKARRQVLPPEMQRKPVIVR